MIKLHDSKLKYRPVGLETNMNGIVLEFAVITVHRSANFFIRKNQNIYNIKKMIEK